MNPEELLDWGLQHYFDDWELEQAQQLVDADKVEDAAEYLRQLAVNSWRWRLGPGTPSYSTSSGRIELRYPESSIMAKPDLTYDIAWFARRVVESRRQVRLL